MIEILEKEIQFLNSSLAGTKDKFELENIAEDIHVFETILKAKRQLTDLDNIDFYLKEAFERIDGSLLKVEQCYQRYKADIEAIKKDMEVIEKYIQLRLDFSVNKQKLS